MQRSAELAMSIQNLFLKTEELKILLVCLFELHLIHVVELQDNYPPFDGINLYN